MIDRILRIWCWVVGHDWYPFGNRRLTVKGFNCFEEFAQRQCVRCGKVEEVES